MLIQSLHRVPMTQEMICGSQPSYRQAILASMYCHWIQDDDTALYLQYNDNHVRKEYVQQWFGSTSTPRILSWLQKTLWCTWMTMRMWLEGGKQNGALDNGIGYVNLKSWFITVRCWWRVSMATRARKHMVVYHTVLVYRRCRLEIPLALVHKCWIPLRTTIFSEETEEKSHSWIVLQTELKRRIIARR